VPPQGPVHLWTGPSGASSRFPVEYPLECYELYAHNKLTFGEHLNELISAILGEGALQNQKEYLKKKLPSQRR